MKDTWRVWALRLLLALLLLATLQGMPFWTPLQRLEFDTLSSLTAPVRPNTGVLVVGLDEPSFAALNQVPPLPRRLHAQLIDALAAAGSAALGIDMLFGTPQSPVDDAAFAQALQGRMPVVLASAEVLVQSSQVAQYRQTVPTIFPNARQGSVALQVDDDGVLRSAPARDNALWRVLAQSAGRPITPPPPGALLRYYAPEVPLPYAHYTQALDPTGTLPPGALQGKLVLLGQNTPIDKVDQFVTPLHGLGGGTQSGVFMHATALINGLTGDWIVPAHPAGPALQAVLAVGLVAGLTRRWRGWRAVWISLALAVLAEPLPTSRQTGLATIMAASQSPSFRLQATNAPFDAKDALKARAYRWNVEQRVWHTRLADEAQLNAELAWLKSAVYANVPARVQVEKLDAQVNYSSRVGTLGMSQL